MTIELLMKEDDAANNGTVVNSAAASSEQQESPSPPNVSSNNVYVEKAEQLVKEFYIVEHPEIKASHGWQHIQRVHQHTKLALQSLEKQQKSSRPVVVVSPTETMEIEIASLLHDLDDPKYFPKPKPQSTTTTDALLSSFPNALQILKAIGLFHDDDNNNNNPSSVTVNNILEMISWVGCSSNGNSIPLRVKASGEYYRLIPRWADRLEAVGVQGVIRCYQYSLEKNRPLCCPKGKSPQPRCEEEMWKLASPQRFENYQNGVAATSSDDMISHYYDKLLHIACPPAAIVCNPYLEQAAKESSKELVKVCMLYGQSGGDIQQVEKYILDLLDKQKQATS